MIIFDKVSYTNSLKILTNITSELNKISNDFLSKKYLLAVSGGVDSMVLLDCFLKQKLNIEVAHFNFQLRGEESNEDEALVKEMCIKNNVIFNTKTCDTNTFAKENNRSIQEAARILRYDWFSQLQTEKQFDYIVTAHHADDSIETFFINLLRGSGIKGLCGIKNTKQIIRPMLTITRKEIEIYAKEESVQFRNDSSNESLKYKRNFIRKKIIPELNNNQESASKSILKSIENLTQANDYLERKITQDVQDILTKKGNLDIVDTSKPIENIVLFTLLNGYGFNSSQVENIQKPTSAVGKMFISKTHKLLIERKKLIIQPLLNSQQVENSEIPSLGSYKTPISIKFTEVEKPKTFANNKNTIYIDADKIKFPLQIRKWQEGDWFIPFGMNGKKKLSDFFIDEKMTRFEKENTWLLVDSQNIIWVVGHRLDERYKLLNSAKKVIEVVTYK